MEPEIIVQDVETQQERTNNENLTYYYSKFDLFDQSNLFLFTKYEIFKKNLKASLGKTPKRIFEI
jgi:hypothetical protein